MSPKTKSPAIWTSKITSLRSSLMFKPSPSPTSTAPSNWRMPRSLPRNAQPEKRYLYHHHCISDPFAPTRQHQHVIMLLFHLVRNCRAHPGEISCISCLLEEYLLSSRRRYETTETSHFLMYHKHPNAQHYCVVQEGVTTSSSLTSIF